MDRIPNFTNKAELDFEKGELILINKPYGVTSFFAVDKIKRALVQTGLKKPKIGHAGTLDPLATGLLIICTGRMTKKMSEYQDMEKTYSGSFTLGASTESYDLEREVIPGPDPSENTEEDLLKVKESFMGYQEIIPPAHSAVKVDGKRAYEMARKGAEVILKPKPVHISQFDMDASKFPEIHFTIRCTKGTYIRSIAHEFGQRLGNAGYLSSLCRDAIGALKNDQAWPLDEFLKNLIP